MATLRLHDGIVDYCDQENSIQFPEFDTRLDIQHYEGVGNSLLVCERVPLDLCRIVAGTPYVRDAVRDPAVQARMHGYDLAAFVLLHASSAEDRIANRYAMQQGIKILGSFIVFGYESNIARIKRAADQLMPSGMHIWLKYASELRQPGSLEDRQEYRRGFALGQFTLGVGHYQAEPAQDYRLALCDWLENPTWRVVDEGLEE